MTSTPTSLPQNTVSASAYLHLAPTAGSSSSSADYNRSEIRQLVLEYLCNGCYADSARAFAEEVARRDADDRTGADERAERGRSANGQSLGLRRKQSEGGMKMEGVETTTDPGARHDADGMHIEGDESDREVERRLTAGKTVAFKVETGVPYDDKEYDGEGGSMLSREQLREVRLRRGMFA